MHNAVNGYSATVLSRDYSIIITRQHLSPEARFQRGICAPQQHFPLSRHAAALRMSACRHGMAGKRAIAIERPRPSQYTRPIEEIYLPNKSQPNEPRGQRL